MNRLLRRFTQALAIVLAGFFLIAVPAQAFMQAQTPAIAQAPPIPIPLPPSPIPAVPVVPGIVMDQLKKIPIPTGRDCLNPPMPADPFAGVQSYIDKGPKKPIAGDPFVEGSGATMYDRYGYAGYNLATFDTPNKLDICQPITVDADQRFSNLQTEISLGVVAVTTQLTRFVTTGTLGSFWDPMQERLTSSLGGKLFVSVSGSALAAAALWVFWKRGRRGEVSKIAAWASKALSIMTLAVGCTFFAVGIGGTVDNMIKTAVQSAGELATTADREPADQVGSLLVDKVMYPTWQRQMFGDNDTAKNHYSEKLWKAGTFTREEQANINANPDTAQATIDARRGQYKTAMLELQEEYPQTYQLAAGMDTRTQLGESTVSGTAVASSTWFLFSCLVLLMWASVIARIGIGIFPAIAIPAVFPRLHGMAYDLGITIVKAVWQAVIAAFAVFVYLVAALAPIMGSNFHPMLKIVMILLVSVAMFKVMKRLKAAPAISKERFKKVFDRKSSKEKAEKSSNTKTKTSSSPIDDLGNLPSAGGPGGGPGMPGAGGGSATVPREVKQTARPVSVGIGAPAVDRGDLGSLKSTTATSSPGTAGAAGRAAPGRRGVLTPAMAGSTASRAGSTAVASAGKKQALAAGASTAAKATPHGRAVVVGTAVAKVATARRGMHQTTSAPTVRPPVTKLGGVNQPTGPVFRPGNASAPATVIQGQVIKRGHHTPANPIQTTGPAAPKAPAPIKRA